MLVFFKYEKFVPIFLLTKTTDKLFQSRLFLDLTKLAASMH